jgi:hypothetical protein
MADDNKDLAELSAALANTIAISKRLAKSADQQVKWVINSSLRTALEMAASKARIDTLLDLRKPNGSAPVEPTAKK